MLCSNHTTVFTVLHYKQYSVLLWTYFYNLVLNVRSGGRFQTAEVHVVAQLSEFKIGVSRREDHSIKFDSSSKNFFAIWKGWSNYSLFESEEMFFLFWSIKINLGNS